MSTNLVVKEIQRFLASGQAEVLCIKGKWGVGKTFAWRRYLEEARKSDGLKRQDYVYVSLFGLNSLDDLRYAIFEGTVPPDKALAGPDAETFGVLVEKGLSLGRRARSWVGPALSAVGLGEVGNAVARSAFLLVRNQLVCLDDLERAGSGLQARDVLGLVSFLKEQRNCKVVLLLNDEAMEGGAQAEFNRLLEKVIDVSVKFAPSAEEAATIAIGEGVSIGDRLRRAVGTLGITNIRVIKKIERLALRLEVLLKSYRTEVLDQAVATCALGGWAVFEPDHAPSLALIQKYNSITVSMANRAGQQEEMLRWHDTLAKLRFSHADGFDQVILNGISIGYFDEDQLLIEAKALEAAMNHNGRDDNFSKAWDRYHSSLSTNDDEILDFIYQGALEVLPAIDSMNINATIRLLREFGRGAEADNLATQYVAYLPNELRSLNFRNHHFSADSPIDPALEAAFRARSDAFEDKRDPRVVVLSLAQRDAWDDEDERLLSKLSSHDFETLIEEIESSDLHRIIKSLLRIAALGSAEARTMNAPLHAALARIASKSPLRARRLAAWGFIAPPVDGVE